MFPWKLSYGPRQAAYGLKEQKDTAGYVTACDEGWKVMQ